MECKKSYFSLDNNEHYLNCSYMSPLLKKSAEVGLIGIQKKSAPYQITPDDFFETSSLIRQEIASLISGSSSKSIALVPSVSYGMSNAARNIQYVKGQNIVILKDEFPSNHYIWQRIADENNIELRIIAPDHGVNIGEDWNKKIIEAIDENTAVVALSHVHWITGTRFDLVSISRRIQETKAFFILDGTQSVGMQVINVTELNIDVLVCSGYKWLFGPYSTGFAYYSSRFNEGIPQEENWSIRDNSHDFSKLTEYTENYIDGGQRFDVGGASNFILNPMLLHGIQQINEWGTSSMLQYCEDLTHELIQLLQQKNRIEQSDQFVSAHLLSLKYDPNSLNDLVYDIRAAHLHVSFRSGCMRISPNVYNTEEDISILCEVINKHF